MEQDKIIPVDTSSILLKQSRDMSGLDFLRAIENGELPKPPLLKTLDFKVVSIDKGVAIFSFQPQHIHYNALGVVHGGVITTILDSAMSCSVHSLLPPGILYTTLELKVNFLKSVTTGIKELTAKGSILHQGRTTAFVESSLIDANNNVYAHGVSTCLLLNK